VWSRRETLERVPVHAPSRSVYRGYGIWGSIEHAPYAQEGGFGKVHQLFPEGLQTIIGTLNVALVA